MMTAAERNLAAEVRAIGDGHRAFVQEGGWVKVVSSSYAGKSYAVTFHAAGSEGPIVFRCQPEGRNAYTDDHQQAHAGAGITPCMHAALAARRLEREGLAVLGADGLWRTTLVVEPKPADYDPFSGLT